MWTTVILHGEASIARRRCVSWTWSTIVSVIGLACSDAFRTGVVVVGHVVKDTGSRKEQGSQGRCERSGESGNNFGVLPEPLQISSETEIHEIEINKYGCCFMALDSFDK